MQEGKAPGQLGDAGKQSCPPDQYELSRGYGEMGSRDDYGALAQLGARLH